MVISSGDDDARHRRLGSALVRRALPPLLAAAWTAWRGHRRLPLVLLGLAAAIAALTLIAPNAMLALDRAVRRFADLAVDLLSSVAAALVTLAFAPLSALLWLLRWDPLTRTSRNASAGWRPHASSVDGRRTFLREQPPGSIRHRVHGAVASIIIIGLIAAVVVAVRSNQDPKPVGTSATAFTPFVFADSPWIGELKQEFDATGLDYDPVLQWRTGNHRGRFLNVEDGIRKTYRPPHPRYRVWMFGGSTLYGYGQRDDHTISSDIARISEANSLPLDITNFGTSGYVNWQETMQFAQIISRGERPDLIVFYDGSNELQLSKWRGEAGDARPEEPSVIFYREIGEKLQQYGGAPTTPVTGPEAGRRAARIYRRGVDVARRLGASYQTPVLHVWQPSLFSKTPWSAADQKAVDALNYGFTPEPFHAIARAALPGLPKGVVDLSSALDGANEPLFYDLVHTNERGSALVAQALFPEIRSALERRK